MRLVGAHIRVYTTLVDVFTYAYENEYSIFQLFLIHQKTKKHLRPTRSEIADCYQLSRAFKMIIVHGAYWINNCTPHDAKGYFIMERELSLAVALGCTHYVFHGGFLGADQSKEESMHYFVEALRRAQRNFPSITFLIENTAHRTSIGTFFNDLATIKRLLQDVPHIQFCLDTAHAHAAGYELITHEEPTLYEVINETIGFPSIGLIHLNDTNKPKGSFHDQHVVLGSGELSLDRLQTFVTHAALVKVPIILELPVLDGILQRSLVEKVKTWE